MRWSKVNHNPSLVSIGCTEIFIRLMLTFVLIVASFPMVASAAAGSSNEEFLAGIQGKLNEDDFALNEGEERWLESRSPASATANYQIGLKLSDGYDSSQARDFIARAAEIRTELGLSAAREYNSLGYLQYLAGEFDHAQRSYQQARSDASDDDVDLRIKIYNNIANLMLERADFDNASRYASMSSALGSEYSRIILEAIQGLKGVDERTKEFYRLLDAGVAERQQGNFVEAIEFYDRALAITPDNFRALNFKGYALFRLARYDEAEAVLARGVQLVPDYNPLRLNLIKSYCSNDKSAAARELIPDLGPPEALEALFLGDAEFTRACAELR